LSIFQAAGVATVTPSFFRKCFGQPAVLGIETPADVPVGIDEGAVEGAAYPPS